MLRDIQVSFNNRGNNNVIAPAARESPAVTLPAQNTLVAMVTELLV